MPAPTPRTTRIGTCQDAAVRPSGLRLLRAHQSLADLAQRDRERLLLNAGLDQRADVLEQALAELGVVGVDLPGPLRRHDDEAVLAVDHIEQIVDGRGDDAFDGLSPGHVVPFGVASRKPPAVNSPRRRPGPASRLPADDRLPPRTC